MKLGELLNVVERNGSVTADLHARDVTDVTNDSRKVKPGSLFVAVRGFHSDGHQFIPQALQQGAVAVVAEQGRATQIASGAPLITVPDSRAALAQLAAAFFGKPSRK